PAQVDPAYKAFDPFYFAPDKNPSPIADNTVYQYVVELWPTTNVFKKGHRIRVSISASDFPHLFPILRPSTNTIVIDENHQ
ncbi:MAG: CocE/NonD family hydrolase C-terminal non-catalytic domain-containing protein, partial [Smithella sp.]|nr:CocE/NonD family hydrolase C-terminal non-catalytic domain-containing protein [Smithella sp.]